MTGVEWLGGGRVLFVSPHPDDVAYSCGGLVDRGLRGRDVHVLTIFSRSRFVALKALRHLDADAISRLRVDEDRAYCRSRELAYDCAGLPDSSLSGYDDRTETEGDVERDDRLRDASRVIAEAFARLRPSTVIAPAAIGGHIDHAIVHHAARRLAPPRLFFFEDLPYAALAPRAAVEADLRRRGLAPAMRVEIALPLKLAGMRAYASQTEREDEELVERHARSFDGVAEMEQLWQIAGLDFANELT